MQSMDDEQKTIRPGDPVSASGVSLSAREGGDMDGDGEREVEGDGERAGERVPPPLRRYVLHGLLALLASPLAGGFLLAARWIAAKRAGAGLLTLAGSLAVTALGLGIGLFVPISLGPAAVLILSLWLAAGLALGRLEARAGLAPSVPWSEEPRPGVQILTWSVVFVVAGMVLAFGLVTVATRWGDEVFAKPSAPREVLLVALLALAPAGALAGLLLGILRRPSRLAPPVLFCASLYLVGLALAGAVPLFVWLARGLGRTDKIVVSGNLTDPAAASLIVLSIGLWFGASLYLAEARRTRELIQRWAVTAGLGFLMMWSFDVVFGDGPVSWRNRWATTAAEEGRPAEAARHWAWAVARAPRDGSTADLALKGAREALLAGDAALARSLLSRIDDALAREHSVDAEASTARAVLASRLDLASIQSAKVAPVLKEGYLDSDWSTLLTAARSVHPGLGPDMGEAEAKQRLQDLSRSASSTELPDLGQLLQLRVAADLFDARAVAVPWQDRGRVLSAGFPVLVRLSSWGRWILVFWSAPGADPVLALDYSRWGDGEKESLDREEVARLLVGGEGAESRSARAQARVGVLLSASRLAVELDRDGGLVFALVPRDGSTAVRSLPDVPPALLTRDLARQEIDRGAFVRGLALAAELTPGPARDELLGAAWLDPAGRALLPPVDAAAGAAVADRWIRSGPGSASPWLVEHLQSSPFGGGARQCELRESILRAAVALHPDQGWYARELSEKAAAAGRSAEAAGLALRYAANHKWSGAFSLQALEPLALMPSDSIGPEARAAVEHLLGRVSVLVPSRAAANSYFPRSSFAEYWAARAVLASDPEEALEAWRRAVTLKPKSARYRQRLADALETAGRGAEASEARRWAAAVETAPVCPEGGA